MKILSVDVAILGAGTAGLAAYRAAKAAGVSVVLIEGGEYGTTCARVGCMPSKLLIAAAEAAHGVKSASGFGIHIDGTIRIDGREVMDRVRRERDRFVGFVLRDVAAIPATERIRGFARFINNDTLLVDEHTQITSKSIVIATGSSADYPDEYQALGERLIINDDVFNWQNLPKSVAVIGTGIIGLEIAQALHRLGVEVAVFGRGGRVGSISDPAIRDYAMAIFNEEFTLEVDANIASVQRDGERVAIQRTLPDGSARTDYFDYVLAATGRTPNVTRLGLEHTTLKLDDKGVPVSDPATTQTQSAAATSPIFIAGDASDYIPLLHEAADEGRIAGDNAARLALKQALQDGLRRAAINITFTDPQIGIVGDGFHALKPGTFATGIASFEDQGRARILLKNQGLLHIYADKTTGKLLGAEMLAPAAEHLAHLLAWALQNAMTIPQMLEMPFYHPVIEEGLRTALRDLDSKLRAVQ